MQCVSIKDLFTSFPFTSMFTHGFWLYTRLQPVARLYYNPPTNRAISLRSRVRRCEPCFLSNAVNSMLRYISKFGALKSNDFVVRICIYIYYIYIYIHKKLYIHESCLFGRLMGVLHLGWRTNMKRLKSKHAIRPGFLLRFQFQDFHLVNPQVYVNKNWCWLICVRECTNLC